MRKPLAVCALLASSRVLTRVIVAPGAHLYTAQTGCVVLDDVDRLVELVVVGANKQAVFSHALVNTLTTLLQSPPPAGTRLTVVATTSVDPDRPGLAASILRLRDLFPHRFLLPSLGAAEARVLADSLEVFRMEGGPFSFPAGFRAPIR